MEYYRKVTTLITHLEVVREVKAITEVDLVLVRKKEVVIKISITQIELI